MSKTERPRRRRRRILRVLLVLIVLLAAIVFLAPTLVNNGLGRGAIHQAIERHVNGEVRIGAIDLGWRGPQSVRGFEIIDEQGRRAVAVDLEVAPGLLDVVLGLDTLTAKVSGEVRGEIAEDGTISLARLMRSEGAKEPPPPPAADEPLTLPAFGPISLLLDDVTVHLSDASSKRDLTFGLQGALEYAPGGDATLKLLSATRSADLNGAFDVDVRASKLVDAAGRLTPRGAVLQAAVRMRSLPVLLTSTRCDLNNLDLQVRSDDLAQALAISITAGAALEGAQASTFEGSLALERPFTAGGEVDFSLDRLTGELRGRQIPTGPFQTMLAGQGVDVERDVGPALDLSVSFAPGAVRDVQIQAAAEHLQVALKGRIDTQEPSLDLESGSRLAATVSPELLAARSGMHMDGPAEVTVEITRAHVPLALEGETLPAGLIVQAVVALPSALTLRPAAGKDTLAVVAPVRCDLDVSSAPLTARLRSSALDVSGLPVGQEGLGIRDLDATVTLGPTMTVLAAAVAHPASAPRAGGGLRADLTLKEGASTPVGRVSIAGVDVAAWQAWLGQEAPLSPWVGERGDIEVTLGENPGGFSATLASSLPGVHGMLRAEADQTMIEVTAPGGVRLAPHVDALRASLPSLAQTPPGALSIERLRLPRALLSGEPLDPSAAAIDVTLLIDPLKLQQGGAAPSSVDQLRVHLSSSDLRQGVAFQASGRSVFQEGAAVAPLQVSGRLGNVLDERSAFSLAKAVLELDASVDGLSPAVLTSPLIAQLLSFVNPIFPDVVRVEGPPIKASVRKLSVPFDGNLRGLGGDLDVAIGPVDLNAGSDLLGVLTLFANRSERSLLRTDIGPLHAEIREGVVRYDNFKITFDEKQSLIWRGTIDLVGRKRDLRTEYPLDGLALSFKEVRGYVEGVNVPLVTRGSLDEPARLAVDPDFDLAGAILQAQLKGGLEKAAGKEAGAIGDLLGELLKGKKKDEPKKP